MRRRLLTAAIFVQGLTVAAGATKMASEGPVLQMFWHLLQNANYGYSIGNMEQAAFIVRGPRGSVSCIGWPPASEPHVGRWSGHFPPGAVAIVHTHRNGNPHPSKTDQRTARETGLPVYTITRRSIYKTADDSAQLVIQDWEPGVPAVIPPCRRADQPRATRRSRSIRITTSNATVVVASQTTPAETPPAISDSQ